MGFSCSCDSYSEFFRSRWQKARKEHRCIECGHVITKGENYENVAGKCEGEFWSDTTCERCADLRQAFIELGFCVMYGGVFFDDYGDYLHESAKPKFDDEGDQISGYELAGEIQRKHRDWSATEGQING
jgi:hypothetical protein